MQVEEPSVLTVPEVAKLLRVSRQSVYIMLRTGKLPHFRVGNKVRFNRADIEAIMKPVPVTKGETK